MDGLTPSPIVSAVSAYSPPKHGAPIDLRLDGNEGQPPPQELLSAVLSELDVEAIRHYPNAAQLERELAESVGVEPERVLVTAGADDGLERLLRATLGPGREVVLPVPTFEMLARYAKLAGGTVVPVPWDDGPLPVNAMLEAVTERTAVIIVVTPNSPTGLVATADDLRQLSQAAPSALLIVDLAYTEFADVDLSDAALALPNAVITRTLSKAWGLAGLRVGWAAGPVEVIGWMKVTGHPYAVASPSLALALVRRRTGGTDMASFVDLVRTQRAELAQLLTELGASSLPSQANFLLARFKDAEWVRDALAGLGIGVRLFPGQAALENQIRMTIPGEPVGFDRLCRGLRAALEPKMLVLGAGCATTECEPVFARLRAQGIAFAALDNDTMTKLEEEGHLPAWLVTTTPAEIENARSHGLVPLGVSGPFESSVLTAAGAARVFERRDQIEELLS